MIPPQIALRLQVNVSDVPASPAIVNRYQVFALLLTAVLSCVQPAGALGTWVPVRTVAIARSPTCVAAGNVATKLVPELESALELPTYVTAAEACPTGPARHTTAHAAA